MVISISRKAMGKEKGCHPLNALRSGICYWKREGF